MSGDVTSGGTSLMPRPGRHTNLDLTARTIAIKKREAEAEPDPADVRLDGIKEKAVAYLDATPPELWTPQMWSFLKDECKKLKPKQSENLGQMSSDDLKKLLDGKSSTSVP